MLQVSISKKAKLKLNLASNLPPVNVDATQMRQIIMNLVINASEAISNEGGIITITTGCTNYDESYGDDIWMDEKIAAGQYVYMEVADNGCGMDNDTLTKIFDPFFTTKFTGRGLGMASVLGIVRSHKGAIKINSETGKGSTFRILLPASENNYHSKDWPLSCAVPLVDDEAAIGVGTKVRS
ncbi:two-component system sensor histidine kinase NtrB [Pelotalea chapellei]|nr:ATP-binding protein [Pelotalea chapellei]